MNRPLQKGTRVSHARSSAKTPSLRTGFFASLRGGGIRHLTPQSRATDDAPGTSHLSVLGLALGTTKGFALRPQSARPVTPPTTRDRGIRRRSAPSLRLIGLLGLAFAAFLALASSALAARGHEFTGTIGTPCTAEPCGPGELKEPSGLAVNEATHDIYVVDKGNDRVQVFSSRGALA